MFLSINGLEAYPVLNKLVNLLGNMYCGVFFGGRNFFARELISGKTGKNVFFLLKPVFLFFFFSTFQYRSELQTNLVQN